MISILLIWAYAAIVSYILGFGLCRLMNRNKSYTCRHSASYILGGLGVLTVYAEFFSLAGPVGLWANVVLIVICLSVTIWCRKDLSESIKKLPKPKEPMFWITLGLVVLFAYGSSFGIMHYDSDLYHGQSVRWIEEYGTVIGLGNLHSRIAYNSAAFPLTALFGFKYIFGKSMHVMAGFLAMITAVLCVPMFSRRDIIKAELSDFVRLVSIYYLINIFDEMVSPASDYFVILFLLCIFILYTEEAEHKNENPYPYAMLSVLMVVVFTVKISAAPVLLLVVYPAFLLIKTKAYKDILKFLLAGIVGILPFFARNILLSGYLIYPVTAIDIFDFDYKIPKALAEYDGKEVRVYGRGHIDVTRFDESIKIWLPDWFESLDKVYKLAFCLSLFSILLLAVILTVTVVRKKYEKLPEMWIMVTVAISFTFWMLSSPNIRFGCIYLLLLPALTFGYVYRATLMRWDRRLFYLVGIGAFLLFKAFVFTRGLIKDFSTDYLICQQDYGQYEVREEKIDGISFYCPLEGDRVGYEPFPSYPSSPDIHMRGKEIKDGFAPNRTDR